MQYRRPAFTLIELLVVIAIIGILATLVIFQLGSSQIRARNAQAQSDISAMGKAVESFRIEDLASDQVVSNLPGSIDQLKGTTGSLPTLFTGTQSVSGAQSTFAAAVFKTPSSDYIYRYAASQYPVGAVGRQLVKGSAAAAPYSLCTTLVNAASLYYCAPSGQGPGPVASAAGQTLADLSPAAQNGLTAWYVLNGSGNQTNATDSSGSGNIGTLNNFALDNGVTDGWAQGMYGKTLRFNGTTSQDFVSVPVSQSVSGSFTASVWAYRTTVLDCCQEQALIASSFNANIGKTSVGFYKDTEQLAGSIGNSSSRIVQDYYSNGTFYSTTGVWYLVTLSVSPTHFEAYVNGINVTGGSYASSTPSLADPSNPFYLGKSSVGSLEPSYGYLSDIRIYNRALSLTEVQKLYQGTL